MYRMARFLASARRQLQLRVSGRFSRHFPVTNQLKKSNLLEILRRINKKPKEPWLCRSLSDLNGEHRHVVVLGGVTDKAEDVGFDVVEQI